MNDRGQYGGNGSPRVGQIPVYVERKSSSIGTWILGAIATGGAVLWARHQSQQIEQLYKTAGLPHQSFAGSLRQDVKALPSRASGALHDLAERVRPKRRA